MWLYPNSPNYVRTGPQLNHLDLFFPPKEHLKILYYYPEDEVQNRKVRNIGLCEALVNFTKTFRPIHPCEAVHTQKSRQVYFEPEPNIWMVMVSQKITYNLKSSCFMTNFICYVYMYLYL